MQRMICFICFLAAVTTTLSQTTKIIGTDQERETIIDGAVSEAKLSTILLQEINRAKIIDDKTISASKKLAKGFKKASLQIQQAGRARIMIEDAVKRAETQLLNLKKETDPQSVTAGPIKEETAAQPGQLLKEDELAKIFDASGCVDERDPANINCFQPNPITYRTIDGTCNNLENIMNGASETKFRRLLPPKYKDGISSMLGGTPEGEESELRQAITIDTSRSSLYPSPRLVSLNIIKDQEIDELPATHMLMQWGQFLDHDLDLAPELEVECEGCTHTEICHSIYVPKDDPTFGPGTYRNGDCLPFRRSIASCMDYQPGSYEPRDQINALTSFIDGSMVYGSTKKTETVLRLFKDGLLRSKPAGRGQKDTLPIIRDLVENEGLDNVREIIGCPTATGDDCFVCGDVRCNEQVSLTIMHTIWMREHNRLAYELKAINPHWTDERLFQEARAIVGAEIQKITYKDFLRLVLGKTVLKQVLGKYKGYKPRVDPSIPNSFSTAAFRFGHSMVQPQLDRLDDKHNPLSIGPLSLNEAFFNPAAFVASGGTDPILRGLVNINCRHVDESVSSQLTNQLFENAKMPGSGLDLASLNIQRSRDHGLPSYTTFRRFCQSVFPKLQFTQFRDQSTYVRLVELYGSLDTVELWVGGLAEEHIKGSLLGPTFACLFGLTFANVRDGDRFYFENEGSKFTQPQISQISKTSLSRVLCDNGDNIKTIQRDAFRTNQARKRCRNIPGINLEPWRERVHYFRLNLPDPDLVLDSYAFLSQNPSKMSINSNENVPTCLPFTCLPGKKHVMLIVPRLSSDARDSCLLKPSRQLEGNFPTTFYYLATFCPMFFPNSGVYTSLDACQKGSVDAFSFDESCKSPGKSNLRLNLISSVPDPDLPEGFPQQLGDILKQEFEQSESGVVSDKEAINTNEPDKVENSADLDQLPIPINLDQFSQNLVV